MNKRTKMIDVAQLADVGTMTVSRVLNNSGECLWLSEALYLWFLLSCGMVERQVLGVSHQALFEDIVLVV